MLRFIAQDIGAKWKGVIPVSSRLVNIRGRAIDSQGTDLASKPKLVYWCTSSFSR